ncbi:FtsX-like permease family protein [Microbacterium sp. Leaf159]|uniref:FtsX-like permease family protein n=1 Tax=Microbacterium sp. Leaf159 TaxID=1736279 RepID=UPI0006FAC311|nr:FtsX-like permease family protein [Microbacterium sp. Leaf159]KQR39795.1 hypothetical protein ASF80_10550 [Microbacterium sp. Leaf159]
MRSVALGELVLESVRSIVARPVLSVLTGLAIGALSLGAGLLEVHALNSLEATVAQQVAAGSDVLVIDADGSPIPSGPCEALARSGDVLEVGSVRSVVAVRLDDGGASSFQLATVSPGYLRVVAPKALSVHAVVAGSAVSDTLGVGAGSLVRLTDGRSLRVGAVLPAGARTQDRDRWMLEIAPAAADASVAECWVESRQGSLDRVREMVPALFGSVGNLRVRSLVSTDVVTAAQAQYEGRVTRWSWVPVAVTCAGMLVISLRPRWPEFALYRIVGFSSSDIAVMFALEAWLLATPATLLMLAAGVAFLLSSGGLTPQAFSVLAATSAMCASTISLAIAALTPPMWSIDLPRYLKGRG